MLLGSNHPVTNTARAVWKVRRLSARRSMGLLLALSVFALGAAPALYGSDPAASATNVTQEDRDALAEELWNRLDLLVSSVLDGNAAGLDDALCLDDVVHARLSREAALGLIPSADDPTLVADRREKLRQSVRRYVVDLLDRGGQIDAIDIARVQLSEENPDNVAGGENLDGEDEPLPITGSGLLAVEMQAFDRDIDLSLLHIRSRWCFDPFTMKRDLEG